jgi:IMP dehydrogenase
MPITNGDAMPSFSENALEYTKALEVLKNEYPERDGIDVKTLIDSAKNGGLTYNDFLMLPGYIGTYTAAVAPPTLYMSLPRLKAHTGHERSRYHSQAYSV